MANNLDKPTLEEQARSIARLGEHVAEIHDPVMKTFVEQVMARVEALRKTRATELAGILRSHIYRKTIHCR